MKQRPTKEQQEIIDAVASGQTLKVAALAGTGKTSTLQFIAQAYPNRKGLYLAYNKALQLDAQKKFPYWIDCKTVHGLAFQKRGFPFMKQLALRPDYDTVIAELEIDARQAYLDLPPDKDNKIGRLEIHLSSHFLLALCREIIRYFTFSDKDTLEIKDFTWIVQKELLERYPELKRILEDADALQDFTRGLYGYLERLCQKIWALQISPRSDLVPADHDTYLKLYQLQKPILEEYDYLLLDEAQDANPCILDILLNQRCQVIYVGDEYQQIYAFRGTVNAMQKVQAPMLYLTQSFRFGDAIAEEANDILTLLKSPISLKGLSSLPGEVTEIDTPPYTFLARTNATLFEKCVEAILKGYRCCLLGDVNKTLSLFRSAFSLWSKKPQWIKDNRLTGFSTWKELIEFAEAEDDSDLLGAVQFIRMHGEKSLELLKTIEQARRVSEEQADIIFSTVHKAKGREWNRVVIANDFTLKHPHDQNVYYVALTRAKQVLHHTLPTID